MLHLLKNHLSILLFGMGIMFLTALGQTATLSPFTIYFQKAWSLSAAKIGLIYGVSTFIGALFPS